MRLEHDADLGDGADDTIAVQQEILDGLLENAEVRLVFEAAADRLAVEHAVGLRPRRAHSGPLARVEDAKLDPRFVGRLGHRAAQCVDLLDEMPFPDAPDRRIAGHLAQRFDVVREQQRFAAHASGRKRGFGPGVTAANNDNVK